MAEKDTLLPKRPKNTVEILKTAWFRYFLVTIKFEIVLEAYTCHVTRYYKEDKFIPGVPPRAGFAPGSTMHPLG